MTPRSVPPIPAEPWWVKLLKLPGRLWALTAGIADTMTEGSRRQPSRRKLLLIRFVLMAVLLLFAPFLFVLRRRSRPPSGRDALQARVQEIWKTSPSDAIALLRKVYDDFLARGGFARIRAVEIAPFGRFTIADVASLQQYLYRCEVAVGNYEGALALAAGLGRVEFAILQQVDCLVAMGRKADAIALLQSNLDLDGWRGTLRRRLVEMGGRPLKIVN